MRYYVVADTHSFYNELIMSLSEKGFFTDTEPHKLIVCGDLFDRGDQSEELQNFIVDLMAKDQVILIRGNHEDLMLELLKNASYYFNQGIECFHHWSNGTVQTLYDLTRISFYQNSYQTVVNKMRETPYIKTIIPSMKDYYETEHYVFVHGWIPSIEIRNCGFKYLPINEWRTAGAEKWEKARWINGMDAWSQGVKVEGKTVICGHYHTSWGHSRLEGVGEEFGKTADFNPFYGDGIIAIDGCTSLTRKVNCLVIDD